jgi:hypothetical protein
MSIRWHGWDIHGWDIHGWDIHGLHGLHGLQIVRSIRFVCALLVAPVMAAPIHAQIPDTPPAVLATAGMLDCRFTSMSTGTWKDGVAESTARSAALTVGYRAIDTDESTAESIVSGARSHITVRLSGNYLHLMQAEPYGALYVTTLFATPTVKGRLQAVHTRHEFTAVSLPGLTSRPEMYVGDCAVTAKKK